MFGIVNKLRGRTGGVGEPGPEGPIGPQGPPGLAGKDGLNGLNCEQVPTTPGRVCYVDNQGYLDPSIYKPIFKSMKDAFKELRGGDTIMLYGKIDESDLRSPDRNVTDVTIRGMNTRTRPGHGGESAMAGGADWGNEKDNFSDPLLTVISQGWRIQNIHFGGHIKLSRSLDMMESGSHAEFRDCTFSGGAIGISDHGGCTNVGIFGCHFYGFNKPEQIAIKSTSTAFAWPLWWEIVGNRFMHNWGHIQLALSNGIVKDNAFFMRGPEPDKFNQIALDLSVGKNNLVAHNNFGCRSDEPNYANTAYRMGAGDVWGPNYFSDKEIYGLPKEK